MPPSIDPIDYPTLFPVKMQDAFQPHTEPAIVSAAALVVKARVGSTKQLSVGDEKKDDDDRSDKPSSAIPSVTNRKRPKMIVFDKDGTLGDDKASLRRWAEGMTRHLRTELLYLPGAPKSRSQLNADVALFHSSIGWDPVRRDVTPSAPLAAGTWEEVCGIAADAFATLGVEGAAVKVGQWHFSLGNLHGADAPLIVDLRGLMIELRERWGVKVAICTSDDRAPTEAAMAGWGLTDVIDYSICGNEVARGKPHPDPLLDLCRLSGLRPSECVVVGDTASDTGMARSAGAGLCVGVLSGSGDAEQLRRTGADVVLGDVGALPGLMEEMWPHRTLQKGGCGEEARSVEAEAGQVVRGTVKAP